VSGLFLYLVPVGEIRMTPGNELDAIRAVAIDYLEGMIYADEARLRRAFHPGSLIVGHYRGRLEFDPVDAFVAAVKAEGAIPAGSAYRAAIVAIDVTGDTAVVKVTDDYQGTSFTDYLTLLKHEGRWQIVNKAFYDHAAERP
jgi:hypothetical protein